MMSQWLRVAAGLTKTHILFPASTLDCLQPPVVTGVQHPLLASSELMYTQQHTDIHENTIKNKSVYI